MTDEQFDKLRKALADTVSAGYADDALVGESIGLYDSDTDATLRIEKRAVLTANGEPVSLLYTTAKRGRICQVRQANMHIHYFYDELGGQKMIAEDVDRNGVSLAEILANAPSASQQEG